MLASSPLDKETPLINRTATKTTEPNASSLNNEANFSSNSNNASISFVKKRQSRSSHSPNRHEANFGNMSGKDENYSSNNISSSNPHPNLKPQLVPIQRFSFFKWQINVDTLVRLFIIAYVNLKSLFKLTVK